MAEKKENEVISWRAAEFKYFEKGILWYASVILAAVLLVIFALWQDNFFFAIFIVLASVVLIFLGRKRPKVVEFRITDNGISAGKDIDYDYEQLEGFTVREYEGRLNEIVVKADTTINPFVKMPVDSQILPKVTEKLKKHIPEKEYEEAIVDTFADLFRF